MPHESAFVREVLRNLAARTEADASRFPQMRHMLVLPAGEEIRIPGVPGGRGIKEFRDKTKRMVQPFGRSRVVGPLPPESAWPESFKPLQAIVAEQASLSFKANSQRPYRIHLFFGGSKAALAALQKLANELAEIRSDITKAMYGKSSPFADGVFFLKDSLHNEGIAALDSWLCTLHWWAWAWSESPFRTHPQIVHAGKAYSTTRDDDAVTSKLSFSLIDADVLTASAVTINLILRFFDERPAMFWSADYPDIPKPEKMKPPDVADLVDLFIGYVTNYLQWQNLVDLTAAVARSGRPGQLPDEGFPERLMAAGGKKFEAAAQIRRYGPSLAAALERYGCDSKDVLSIVHCAGPGGGGPEHVRPGWGPAKIALQQAAIRLRAGQTRSPEQADAGSDAQFLPTPAVAEVEVPSTEPLGSQTQSRRHIAVLRSIAQKFDGYAALSSPNDLVEVAGLSGGLLHAARQAGAFDPIEWDELDPCFRYPPSGAPQEDGRRLLNCVAHRLAKSRNAAEISLKFVAEPPHPKNSYDFDWLRLTFARLAALVRSEAARLQPISARELPESEWLTVTAAAKLLMKDFPHFSLQHARSRVSDAAGKEEFRTNGKTRQARRIEPISFDAWRLKQRDKVLDRDNAGH